MKNLLFSLFIIFSFITKTEAQVFDCHNRVFSFEKICDTSIIFTEDSPYSEYIKLHLENGHSVLIQKVHSQDYRCLFNTIEGCRSKSYSKLHRDIYSEIRDGKFDEYIVYFKGYYKLGKLNYYEFSLVSYKELEWSMYTIKDIQFTVDEDKLIISVENETEDFDISINTKYNPIDKPFNKGNKIVHVKYGILDYFKVLNSEEIEEIESFKRKKGIVLQNNPFFISCI